MTRPVAGRAADRCGGWRVGDEAITRGEKERVTLLSRHLRITGDGYTWYVILSAPREGHGEDLIEFPVYEGNLLPLVEEVANGGE